MSDARRSGYALGDQHGQLERNLADPSLRSPSLEEQPLRAVGDVLAAGLDEELGRLEHARADRAVRKHENARTGQSLGALVSGTHLAIGRKRDVPQLGTVADQGLEAGVSLRHVPPQVVDLSLEPVRGGNAGRNRRIGTAGEWRSESYHRATASHNGAQLST